MSQDRATCANSQQNGGGRIAAYAITHIHANVFITRRIIGKYSVAKNQSEIIVVECYKPQNFEFFNVGKIV